MKDEKTEVLLSFFFYKIINNLAMVLHSCQEKEDERTRKLRIQSKAQNLVWRRIIVHIVD